MSSMTTEFLKLRKQKRQIKKFLKSANSKDIIKRNIDSRCLKLLLVNNDSLILKANKKLRDCNDEMFSNVIYNFLINVLKEDNIELTSQSLSLITDITYHKDDYVIVIEI